ncbi:MAG: hypothetical protein [Microviridae sp.]|nr:MAG: hypothetical protein [Microviridae sp.]
MNLFLGIRSVGLSIVISRLRLLVSSVRVLLVVLLIIGIWRRSLLRCRLYLSRLLRRILRLTVLLLCRLSPSLFLIRILRCILLGLCLLTRFLVSLTISR